MRALAFVGAICLLIPGTMSDLFGLAVLGVIYVHADCEGETARGLTGRAGKGEY